MSFDIAVTRRVGDGEIACRIAPADGLTVLFGPSGAGKTSVLNMVAGLLRPDAGHVRVGGETLFDAAAGVDLAVPARRAGYVFQEPRLFPHLRVSANLAYGARGERTGPLAPEEVVEFLGIGHLLDRWPRTLSGGEARRVAIGRALLSDPAFLLLDEPLSFLDRARREEIMAVIERLRDTVRLPILMVTHDRGEAERLASHIVEM
ncbi:ATP-binding cassette domain-containing protein [Sphingomonas canadensis]|uniref:ATP-binding cassette domain-containing protein n=1 Tax=Sphingomonas canadensis TaxID=1219257 RepID=A0ABW3H2S6_9SPHN|nr:ATP-binding cassette domain-containing protein [Sphingomonas canadensis]MCW3835767.1 ATP-binding cassette domain-containing protein [Sphingomonas canadensis]